MPLSKHSIFRFSIEAELIWSYLIILGIGGLATSILGSWVVSTTIMMQARSAVAHDAATNRTVYEQTLQNLRLPVESAASGITIQYYLKSRERKLLFDYLAAIRKGGGFDFLSLTDAKGLVILRTTQPDRTGDDLSSISVVKAALGGKAAAATQILPAEALAIEDGNLPARARFRTNGGEKILGMSLVVAAPVRAANGEIMGVLEGGVLLGRNYSIVNQVSELLFSGAGSIQEKTGAVTIFQGDVRIDTNTRTAGGDRAFGTQMSPEVHEAVLSRGEIWRGRALINNEWYICEYDPVRNYDGAVIGMLGVGRVESTYTSIRNQVVFSFFCLAIIGFMLIIGITYYMIRKITHPLGEMVTATRSISEGRFDLEVHSDYPGQIALLADSFNLMLKSLRQMRGALEEWGRTLEQKVNQRTEELGAMQVRVAQSERLASLGMLAAGVAHEVNNPLGGILALTALTLEDMPKDHPDRENLEEVIRQTERCRDIVKGLLEFSRQSRSNQELVDLNRILEETLALVSKQSMFFNISLVSSLAANLPPVMADRSQIQQVFINILMNAVQAMKERGTLSVATRHAGNSVEVAISDTGCGIPQEQISRIFDPFFTTKDSGQGTGLGLSIAYGIVTTHRGTISVQSEVGKGSTFTIRMPVAPSGTDFSPHGTSVPLVAA